MKRYRSRLFCCLLALFVLASLPGSVSAQGTAIQACELSGTELVTDYAGFSSLQYLFNNSTWDPQLTGEAAHITLEYEDGIGSLYLCFASAYGEYRIVNNDNGAVCLAGTDLFLHEFIDLTVCFGYTPASVTISFDNGPASMHELDIFTAGEVPATVQKWEHPPEGEVDLMLFAAHSDDDQLFFSGLLPYYAVERGYEVLAVYLTDHHNTAPHRAQELLDGLWAVGVTNYPVIGHFPDFYDAYDPDSCFRKFASMGYSREELTGFVIEQLCRYKPMVAVGHDLNGEYGHPQHMVFSQLLVNAVARSSDPERLPDTAQIYGIWDVPKTYLHLYPQNPIVMDWDQPMGHFDGMTPYEVSKKLGFPAHKSQQKRWAWYYQDQDTAAGMTEFSPCQYGLYRSTVGADALKNDMFENLITHTEHKALEARKLTEEALLAEEMRLEEERRRQEETEAVSVPTESASATEAPTPEDHYPTGSNAEIPIAAGSVFLLLAVFGLMRRRRHR